MKSFMVKGAAGLALGAAFYAVFLHESAKDIEAREQRLTAAFQELQGQPEGSFRIVPEQDGENQGGQFRLVIKKAEQDNVQGVSAQGAAQTSTCTEFQVIMARRNADGQLMIAHTGLVDSYYAVDTAAKTINVDAFNPSSARLQKYCKPAP